MIHIRRKSSQLHSNMLVITMTSPNEELQKNLELLLERSDSFGDTKEERTKYAIY